MHELFAMTILPYSLVIGIGASVLASVSLVVGAIHKKTLDARIFDRLSKVEAEIKQDTTKIEIQMSRAGRIEPERARSVMLDLSVIASDLQRRTEEAQSILDELRDENTKGGTVETAKKIADLDIGVGEAGSRVKGLLRKIESERQQLSDVHPANAVRQS